MSSSSVTLASSRALSSKCCISIRRPVSTRHQGPLSPRWRCSYTTTVRSAFNKRPHISGSCMAAAAPAAARRSQVLMYETSHHDNQASSPHFNSAAETAILSAALQHVPRLGFTQAALTQGALDQGYLPATANNLFPRGPFDIFLYHLSSQRLALKSKVQFPPSSPSSSSPSSSTSSSSSPRDRIRSLLVARLQANEHIAGHLTSALALISLPRNLPSALHELSLLADEVLHLTGDTSLDTSWYTKRAAVAAIYASAEVFQSQDSSVAFTHTEQFLHRRIDEAAALKDASDDLAEWLRYTGLSTVNVLRSWGVRI